MIARWIEWGPWAGGPVCFSSSSGWERLMDPNWTHIYWARFSWSVTGDDDASIRTINKMIVLAILESFIGWMKWAFFFLSPLPLWSFFQRHKYPEAICENRLMLWRKGWWRHDSSVVVETQCNNNPFSLWKKNARMCETARRAKKRPFDMSVREPAVEHKVIFAPVFGAKCEHSRETCSSVRASGKLRACLRLRRGLGP